MLRVGIVGLGGMGRGRLRYYQQIPEARVEAVADVRAADLKQDDRLAAFWELPADQVRWFEDFRDMVAAGAVDMVDICLPTGYHRAAAVAALQNGVHALCEKPMALSLADCEAMVAAQRESGKQLMVAHCIRFWPEYQYLVDHLQSGEWGKLLSLQLVRQGGTPLGGWMEHAIHSGGAILDLHIHDLDFCQYALGLPQQVYAQGGQSLGDARGYDYMHTTLDYGSGLMVSAASHWTDVRIPFVARYEARFEGAFLQMDTSKKPTLTVYRAGASEPEVPVFSDPDAYLNEIRYFLRCIQAGQEPTRCTPVQSRHAVALSLAAAASIARGGLVPMSEFAG